MSSILNRIMPLDAIFLTLDGLLAKAAAALVRTPRPVCVKPMAGLGLGGRVACAPLIDALNPVDGCVPGASECNHPNS